MPRRPVFRSGHTSCTLPNCVRNPDPGDQVKTRSRGHTKCQQDIYEPARITGRLKAREKLHTGAHTILSHHPFGTGFGSTVGAALVSVAAEAAGAGTISIFTCAATGVVVGGWAGLAISRRRLKRTDADVLRRRTRTIRLLKVARMLRRRNVA